MVYKDENLMRDLLQAFHAEAPDHLQTLNASLLQIERGLGTAKQTESLQEAFRAAHSLKGAARAVDFTAIEMLAHNIEEVLKQARDNGLVLDASICDVLYQSFDVIQKLLDGEQVDSEACVNQLSTIKAPDSLPFTDLNDKIQSVASITTGAEDTIRVAISKLDTLMAQGSELLTIRINTDERLADIKTIRRQITELPQLWREFKTTATRSNLLNDDHQGFADFLRNMEESVNNLGRIVNRLDTEMNRDAVRLEMVSSRLQSEMRRVRMVPFSSLEPLFQRTVRDAARLEGKQVELSVVGGEVELDKKVLEALKDTFLHLLRNAVSHGIELPDIRTANNKSSQGEILVRIVQKGNEAHITVRDDGAGFDLATLSQSAEFRHLELSEEANANDIVNLAFLPGVTTSREVTAISGRGVGLDVVRQQVANLQGRLQVEQESGKGVSFQLMVPISLAMTRILLIQSGIHHYALPLSSVERIVSPETTYSVAGRAMLTLGDESMPLVPLASILNQDVQLAEGALAVIVSVGEQKLALLVDEVLTEQELAVQPLPKPLVRVRHISGTAILGSGEPVVVFNVADLVRSAYQKNIRSIQKLANPQVKQERVSHRILVVDDSITTRTLEKNILEAAGYEVLTATDGVRALQQVQTQAVALMVADVEMPNMDGITLTRHLRDSEEFAELPIVLVTSLESKEDRERGMLAGANAYVVKRGFNQTELLATIAQLL